MISVIKVENPTFWGGPVPTWGWMANGPGKAWSTKWMTT
jgi:hypothetical protein